MKWATLLKDIKSKVGLAQSSDTDPFAVDLTTPPSSSSPPSSTYNPSSSSQYVFNSSPSRDNHELELDFKRLWEEFRSSSSEKEKEASLNLTVDTFCRLVKRHANVDQLVTMLVETHIFSFVIGRAFVTDIEKLKIGSKTRSLDVEKVLKFFSDVTKEGFSPGANLLTAVEVLVSGPIDKQSLLDSGIFSCLIHVLSALLAYDELGKSKITADLEEVSAEKDAGYRVLHTRRLEVEGSVVHIMKALASNPSAAQSLIEDDSLESLFNMVANGSVTVFSQYKEGLVPLHNIQLHRHAMQILGLLLVNDNGSTARYIRKHHLIKVLLMAVKDFDPNCGDSAYTMGIVDLLLECVELSYRPEAGGVRLREDIRNAHGYHFLVQFALILSSLPKNPILVSSRSSMNQDSGSDGSEVVPDGENTSSRENADISSQNFAPSLSRLLDVLVTLAQTGPAEPSVGRASRSSQTKPTGHNRSRTSSVDSIYDETWEQGSGKVKDLEAVQMLQDIFLKAENKDLQAEVLNRMFKIFSSHVENYRLCQELRTVPLLVLNMAGFPSSLQDIILKILEYAVTVVNCVPEQELLSLCCLLQQPITSQLKHTILSFFVKLISFDQQYKKVLREVGVLEVLQDDLKQHKLLMGPEQYSGVPNHSDWKPSSGSFKMHLDTKDAIISSPKLMESGSGKLPVFEVDNTITVGWDCMIALLKKAEANQASFRAANGVAIILPFLISDAHRTGVLRILSCLITEDSKQVHHDELGAVVDLLKSGMVTGISGHQYKLHDDAKCDTMGALWRIVGVNGSAQRVFGEATGFSLLLTTLHTFRGKREHMDESDLTVYIKLFKYLFRLMTAAVCENAVNRMKLHAVITSQTFYELLVESGLLCVELERQVIQLLLELALEVVLPPFLASESTALATIPESEKATFIVSTPSGQFNPEKERIYNPGAVRVLIRSLLLFSPKMQLELLKLLESLARASPFNQENLTSIGCVELLLEIIYPFLAGSSPFLSYALKIVEILGAYRLSPSELRMLFRYVLQMRIMNSGHAIVGMMEKLILMEDTALEHLSLAPFVEMDMSKTGHASVQVSLGERSWPPAAGYSFVCWFQFRNFLTTQGKESEASKVGGSSKTYLSSAQQHEQNIFRMFSVGAVSNESPFYAELYFQEDGVLTLATSNSHYLSFSGLEIEEGRWHHLAVVHSKPNALAGLFQASVAYVYLDGKLRHTGKLGYSPSPVGKSLQVTVGTPATCARVSDLTWKTRSCYLFEEVLTSGCIGFMYILGRGYKGLYQDADLLRFVPNQACGGGSMAILDSLDTDMTSSSNGQKFDGSNRQGDSKADGSGIVWDLERLGNLAFQLPGKKLIFAFDGTCSEFIRASGNFSLLNLVDPLSAAASPIGGIPRFGRLMGNVSICRQSVIGDTIRPVGGMTVVLALVEAAESRDMLHMALSMLSCALHQNPQNVKDMQIIRGYHLLALFLRPKMTLFDMQSLEIFFQIAACEALFSEPKKLEAGQSNISMPPTETIFENSYEDLGLSRFRYDSSSVGSHGDMDDFSVPKDSFSHLSELETDMPVETSNCIVLSNADMVEHVLLDWTLWVTSPVSIQIALLGFLENLVSMHWYRNHNLTILRRINLVEHLLVTLQRGDVEVPVLEKLVVLLGCILEDGFLTSELEDVVRFVIMTFNPPEVKYESWDDPEVPKFHYGSHYSSAGIVLFYLIRLPPFSAENQKLQGGQFDHADRLFNSIKDTWLSAAGKGNTSDVKELIPEFFYMPEFLENRFSLDLGEKQSGEKVCVSSRYESWDDPEVPKFHYGSHYSSAGIVLFYLIRLPPFSAENQKLQGGQFDHADRLFNSIKDTWLSAAGKGNTSDVKELIPEFFYMPEFLENRFSLDLGEKQSGEKVGDVFLPPWARGSVREFILKHREALESDYVSENLHHWIDLIFGYKQRGKAAEDAVNVFYHYTYEGNVDIDAVTDPAMKASILAQINHFGQTPKQLFPKAHVKRRTDRKIPLHPLKHSMHLVPHETRKCSSSISQIITFHDKVLVAGANCFLKPRGYTKYITWGFPDRSLRFMSYDQDKLLSTHENLHESNQIQCAGVSHDGRIVVTGAEDGLVCVWRVSKDGPRGSRRLRLEKALCAHTAKVTCLRVSQPYMMIASGSDDCTVIIWDLSSLSFVRQLPDFPVPISAIYINDLTGEIATAAGTVLAVWSINGDCLAVANTSQLPSDSVLSVTGSTSSDWLETSWYVTGHQSGAVKVWRMIHCTDPVSAESKTSSSNRTGGLNLGDQVPEYKLILHKVLKFHKQPVTALYLTSDLKQLLSGDSAGQLLSWTLPDETLRASLKQASLKQASLKQASLKQASLKQAS
ncbi:PREDICTED: protein SPIRRIG-like [Camelina sativa]|uniref:Protein SPIRRIG-like n=2 Tax=Camelina sativa TaxID=90675 RepID=A0ABM0YIB1_CAMSA|nr:PREDICTED: protein SPIRRIG-like [Camelina sativa]